MQEGILDNLIIKNCDIVIDKKRILFKKNNHLIISIGGDLGLSLIPKLIPLLNGKNSFEKILQSLGEFGKEKVIGVLNMLQNHNIIGRDKDYVGLISSEEYHTFQHQIKFFSVKDELMKYEYHERLRHAKVTLLVSTNFFLPLIKNFIHSGIGEITVLCKNKKENENCKQLWKGEFNSSSVSFTKVIKKTFGVLSEEKIFENDPNFIVVANENISSHSLSLINSWSIKHRTPWISFSDFYEIETIIGPMIIPNKTACYECFELRRDSNMPLFKEIRLFNKERKQLLHKQKNKRYLFPFITIICGVISLEVIKYLSGIIEPTTLSRIFTINWLTLETKTHRLLKLPRCPACGIKEKAPLSLWKEPEET